MEIKKDPKVNLEMRKTTFVLAGLVGALAILFIGLEYSNTSRRFGNIAARMMDNLDDEDMILTVQTSTPPPPPPPPPVDVIEELKVVDDNVDIEEFEYENLESDDEISIEVVNLSNMGPSVEEEADDVEIHAFVDQQPEFPGGEGELMAFIKKHLKYPAFAVENNIQGRVSVGFIVEKDGSIGHIEVMRAPAEELSKEAVRVVSCMPKWKPGKQHGRPVRVKYVLPVTFRLQ